jgi:hypothetical protein
MLPDNSAKFQSKQLRGADIRVNSALFKIVNVLNRYYPRFAGGLLFNKGNWVWKNCWKNTGLL